MDPSYSLVGARELPSDRVLSRETFSIIRGGGVDGGPSLSYEWHPDNSIAITHSVSDGNGRVEVLGSETVHIAPEAALEFRELVRRIRPEALEGPEHLVRPIGCEPRSNHDLGEVFVAFINAGSAPGIEDDEVGVFALPSPQSCNTPAAIEARALVDRALQLLPRPDVVAEFERSI